MITRDARHAILSALVDSTEVGVRDTPQIQSTLRRSLSGLREVGPEQKDELYSRSLAIGRTSLAGWRNMAQKGSSVVAPTLDRLRKGDQSFGDQWLSSDDPVQTWAYLASQRVASISAQQAQWKVKALQELISLSVDLAVWASSERLASQTSPANRSGTSG